MFSPAIYFRVSLQNPVHFHNQTSTDYGQYVVREFNSQGHLKVNLETGQGHCDMYKDLLLC